MKFNFFSFLFFQKEKNIFRITLFCLKLKKLFFRLNLTVQNNIVNIKQTNYLIQTKIYTTIKTIQIK